MGAAKRKHDGTRYGDRSTRGKKSEDKRPADRHSEDRRPDGRHNQDSQPDNRRDRKKEDTGRRTSSRKVESCRYDCPLCADFTGVTEVGLIRHCLTEIQESVDFVCSSCGQTRKPNADRRQNESNPYW